MYKKCEMYKKKKCNYLLNICPNSSLPCGFVYWPTLTNLFAGVNLLMGLLKAFL